MKLADERHPLSLHGADVRTVFFGYVGKAQPAVNFTAPLLRQNRVLEFLRWRNSDRGRTAEGLGMIQPTGECWL